MRIEVDDAVRAAAGWLAAHGAEWLGAGPSSACPPPVRGARAILRATALAPLARTLARSPILERRAVGAMLAAAVEAGDYASALALAATAARPADRRAEKIVSRRYRFVWICNPKVASRSMIAALLRADPEAVLVRGRTLEEVLARHPGAASFRRFAFLRHPVGRTLSFHADKHALAVRERKAYRWFVEPWHGVTPGMGFAGFCRWLDTPCGSDVFADRHWLSQSRQVAGADGRLPEFLGRFETLEADWRRITARLGLPPAPLPRLNPRPPGPAPAPDAETAALLRRRYARDFALGGYAGAS